MQERADLGAEAAENAPVVASGDRCKSTPDAAPHAVQRQRRSARQRSTRKGCSASCSDCAIQAPDHQCDLAADRFAHDRGVAAGATGYSLRFVSSGRRQTVARATRPRNGARRPPSRHSPRSAFAAMSSPPVGPVRVRAAAGQASAAGCAVGPGSATTWRPAYATSGGGTGASRGAQPGPAGVLAPVADSRPRLNIRSPPTRSQPGRRSPPLVSVRRASARGSTRDAARRGR
jgi:hypothetical protein